MTARSRKPANRWQLDRKIPVTLIVTVTILLLTQSAAAVWWASRMDYRMELAENTLKAAVATVAVQGERLIRLETRGNPL